MTEWVCVGSLRYNKVQDSLIIGSVWPVDGLLRAEAWPVGEATKRDLGEFLTVSRAQRAVDDALGVYA